MLCFNEGMYDLAVGIDIGGTKILTVVVDATGAVVYEARTPTEATRGSQFVLGSVLEAVDGAIAQLPPESRDRLRGVGVSAAGQVDHIQGLIAYASPNIPGWTGTRIAEAITARCGLPVVVENDANAAAFGEWWLGAGRGVASVAVITVGTGIGSGLIVNGRLLRGGRFRGGELGHLIIEASGVMCNCGQRGCLEAYASGTAIARLAREARPDWSGTTPDIFACAKAGEAWALAILQRAARYLACGIVSVCSVVDPDRVLLGGGVMTQPLYLPLVQEALRVREVTGDRPMAADCVRLASLGETAGAVGAAGACLQSLGLLQLQSARL
jgi:glucokinase